MSKRAEGDIRNVSPPHAAGVEAQQDLNSSPGSDHIAGTAGTGGRSTPPNPSEESKGPRRVTASVVNLRLGLRNSTRCVLDWHSNREGIPGIQLQDDNCRQKAVAPGKLKVRRAKASQFPFFKLHSTHSIAVCLPATTMGLPGNKEYLKIQALRSASPLTANRLPNRIPWSDCQTLHTCRPATPQVHRSNDK